MYWTEQNDYGNWYVVSELSSTPYGNDYDAAVEDCKYWNFQSEHWGEDE